jgi:TolA-binding protein
MPQSVLAGLFDARHAQPKKHQALSAAPKQVVPTSTPASPEGRRLNTQRSRQTETIVRALAEAHDVNPSRSSGKAQATALKLAMFQRLRCVRPSRTPALIGIGLIAIIGTMVLITHRAPTPAPAAPAQVPTSAVHAATARQSSDSHPAAARPTASALLPTRSKVTAAALAAPVRAIPHSAAAIEKLASGDYRGALAAYRELASAFPEQPAYAAAASVLQRRLDARCKQRAETGDPACSLE